MQEWDALSFSDDQDEGVRPGVPVLLSLGCVIAGLILGALRSLPVNAIGYVVSTFLALSLNARYWRLDIEARRDYRYSSSRALRVLAGLCVGLSLVAAVLNVWKIAFHFATR